MFFCQSDGAGVVNRWGSQFALGTNAQDYYFDEISSTVNARNRTWKFDLKPEIRSFVLVHFKPYITYSGSKLHFDSYVLVNGVACSTKSAAYSHASLVLDTMCSFVAEKGSTYSLELIIHNDRNGITANKDSGEAILSIVLI